MIKTKSCYPVVALATLFSLLLSACCAQPTVVPTPPPYTPPPPGTVSPIVIQRTPERGEELPPDGEIVLTFDRAMDRSSVEAAFEVSPEVRGDLEWTDGRTVRFKPVRDLKRDQAYYVTVGDEAKAQDGNPLDGAYRFRFQTVGYLAVTQVIPAPDSEDVEATSTVTVMFNRPVVPLTAVSDPGYGDLPDPVTFEPAIEGDGEWLNTSIYVFTPAEPLAGGTTFTARVPPGLTDTTGGVLEEAVTWSFSTRPPQVTWVSPQEGAELVGVDAPVQITFDMPVDCDAATEAFNLRTGLLGSVPGSFTCEAESLTFTPDEWLAFDTTYTAQVDRGVTSAGGGEGMRERYEWRFTTVPLPRIVNTYPRDGERNASPYTDFTIEFNAPIDPGTVMAHVEMTPPISPSQLYTYSGRTSFSFGFGALPSTDYEVRIAPGIADPYGNTIDQGRAVRFRTADLEPVVQLHVPGQVGTYDANQPAQVVIGHLNVPRLDLTLHQLEVDGFFQAQQNWWEYTPSPAPVRRWQVSVEAPLNETGYVLVDLVEGGGTLAPGIYMLDVEAPGVEYRPWGHRVLLVVSELNLTVKASWGELWVWATDLATGRPVEGLGLTVQEYDGSRAGTTSTDEDGIARVNLGDQHYGGLYVLGSDPFVMGATDWNGGIGQWDFGLEPGYDQDDYRAHVYTDRPIYRPGQTVYFRGIVRAEDDVAYSMPGGGSVMVTAYDVTYEQVYQETLSLDAFGAFDGEFTLGEGASLGQYVIEAVYIDQTFGAVFTVAAYRPPEFEVLVMPGETELAAGQSTSAEVGVRYFFGGPVADARVEWNVLTEPYHFEPAQFGRYDFTDQDSPWTCRWCWWWQEPTPDVLLSGTGTTDAQGNLTVELPTQIMTGGQRLTVEATAYGQDGQTISGRSDVVVHQGEFYVGLAPQRYVGRAGNELAVDVVTVDWAGERLGDQELDVEVYRREWVNTFVEDTLGGGSWEWETVDTLVYTGSLTTDGDAEGMLAFTPEEGGSYRVMASGRDRRERRVQSATWVWVSGRDYVSWRRENNDRLTLISDKSTYVPGETAEILIPSPFSGQQWAWITVERGGIRQQEVVMLESNSTVYQLPITADHAPNVYVSAVIVKGPDENEPAATHKVGYVALTVEPVEQTLNVTLTPSVEQAEPGDTVSFELQATDAGGAPVQAAFSLDLVDKAVLSLKPRTSDGIVKTFYGRRGLGVGTASGLVVSVNRLLLEQMEALEEELAYSNGVGGGDEMEEAPEEGLELELDAAAPAPGAPMPTAAALERKAAGELPAGVELRGEFQDTAFWEGTVVTDEAGRAGVEVQLPDNLTTWVLRGVGVTAGTEVGEETIDLLVTKPLLVRPVTPRFFVVGDRSQLAALVSNNTGEDLDVTVTLAGSGFTLDGDAGPQVSVALPAGSEEKVTWWVEVEDVPAVDVAMSAVAGEYTDAARPRLTTGPEGTLLVYRYTAPEIVGTGGQLTGEDARTEVVALPPKYDDRRGELTIRLDPSLAAGMTEGLDYLEHFPYECTEQIVSRFLPNVLTYRALQDLGLEDPELEARLPDLVAEGLEKLALRQHGDGGWGWWSGGESNPYLTAYVVFAMVKAQEAGFEVQANVLANGLSFLTGSLVRARELQSYQQANRQAFVLFVLAEAGETGQASEYVGDLYSRRDRLSHYGRAFLAMALGDIDAGDDRIGTLLSDLQNAAILSATGAHWEEENYDHWAMNTDTRSTAVILDTLARLDPDNDLIPNVVRWLMVARRDGIWETTQETAWALIALTDWMVVTGELQGNYDYGAWLNDNEESLVTGSVTPENVDESIHLQVAVADLLAETGNRLTVGRGPGEGRLYYTAHLKVYLPVEEIEPLNRGVIVSRRYVDPACTAGAQCPQVEQASVGDVVQVQLTIIAPHDLYYVVVEDPLPAGAEAIDTGLDTTSLLEQEPGLYREAEEEGWWYDFYHWWWQWYSRSEMRDEKVVLFADYLPAGTYEYTYTFRATQPGEYHVIPTSAHEFYFPEVFGRADGRLFTVVEGE